MMVNGSNLALHHNAHFSDKEDGGYEGGAAHGSSGKKKPVAAVPQVTKPTSMEDFEIMSKLGIRNHHLFVQIRRWRIQLCLPSQTSRR